MPARDTTGTTAAQLSRQRGIPGCLFRTATRIHPASPALDESTMTGFGPTHSTDDPVCRRVRCQTGAEIRYPTSASRIAASPVMARRPAEFWRRREVSDGDALSREMTVERIWSRRSAMASGVSGDHSAQSNGELFLRLFVAMTRPRRTLPWLRVYAHGYEGDGRRACRARKLRSTSVGASDAAVS